MGIEETEADIQVPERCPLPVTGRSLIYRSNIMHALKHFNSNT